MWKYLIAAVIIVSTATGCSKPKEDKYVLQLTPVEKQYIEMHTVRFGVSRNRAPLIIVNDDTHVTGLAIDYLELIKKRTGLKVEFVGYDRFNDGVKLMNENKVDALLAVKAAPSRVHLIGFTPPYLYAQAVMMQRLDLPLDSPLKVAYSSQFIVTDFLDHFGSQVRLIDEANDEAAYSALLAGKVDTAIMDESAAEWWEAKYNQKFARSHVKFVYDYSMGYALNNEVLGTILQKGLATITREEDVEIYNKWNIEIPRLPQAK